MNIKFETKDSFFAVHCETPEGSLIKMSDPGYCFKSDTTRMFYAIDEFELIDCISEICEKAINAFILTKNTDTLNKQRHDLKMKFNYFLFVDNAKEVGIENLKELKELMPKDMFIPSDKAKKYLGF